MSGLKLVGAAGLGYLAGLTPSADVVTRVATGGRMNIREEGTGNPGAANVAGVLGKKWGAAVLAADMAKGFLGSRIGGRLAGGVGRHVGGPASVAGHCWPLWAGLAGGKGVATSGGQVLATHPVYFPIDAAIAATASRLPVFDRKAFAATEVASTVWVIMSAVWWRKRWPNPGGVSPSPGLPLAALATSAIIRARFLQTNRSVDQWRAQRADDATQ